MRSSLVALVILGSGGCSFQATPASIDDQAPVGDDQPPAPGEAGSPVATCTTFSSQLDSCALTFGSDLALSGTLTYDTATHVLSDAGGAAIAASHVVLHTKGDDVDAIYARNVQLAANTKLRATGATAFAIIAMDSITLGDGALIDVSAGGAGARGTCGGGLSGGQDNGGGAGGGGGGGYGADGGGGGQGNDLGARSAGGKKGDATKPMPAGPRGGCPGAKGGDGSDPGGAAGPGGGAVYLVAANHIDLGAGATITAGGGGGAGGHQSNNNNGDGGGGGGGSGGMILLEAAHVMAASGIVAANGGGGGEGSGNGNAGAPGAAGSLSNSQTPGGAAGSPTGADGGLGGSRNSTKGSAPTTVQAGGGGGGGGGVGFVQIKSSDAQPGTVSPQAM